MAKVKENFKVHYKEILEEDIKSGFVSDRYIIGIIKSITDEDNTPSIKIEKIKGLIAAYKELKK